MKYFFLECSIFHLVFSKELRGSTHKIVGGVEATKGRYPYQVALVHGTDQYCGGTLVDKDWVLTAAHCMGFKDKIHISRHDLDNDSEKFVSIEVEWETPHPDYNDLTTENDIMMMKLKESSSIIPVKLDDGSTDLPPGLSVTAMGWGETSFEGPSSNVLLEIEVDVVSNAHCNADYGGDITDDMMCTSRSGKDSCRGDSGGPLIIKGQDASMDTQIGVVSWGNICSDAGYPGVYARVGSKIEWINEQIESGTKPGDGNEDGNVADGNGSSDYASSWNDENGGSDKGDSLSTDDKDDWSSTDDDTYDDWSSTVDNTVGSNNDFSDEFGEGEAVAAIFVIILSQLLELFSIALEKVAEYFWI